MSPQKGTAIVNKLIYKLLIIFILLLTGACSTSKSASQATTNSQQLRISNVGDKNIQDLNIVFPGTTTAVTRINFGSIDSGQTTEYKLIPGGVYRYSAYEYTLDGDNVFQAVVDWVGEKPLPGTRFTYQIVLDETKVQGDQIQLVNVLTDK